MAFYNCIQPFFSSKRKSLDGHTWNIYGLAVVPNRLKWDAHQSCMWHGPQMSMIKFHIAILSTWVSLMSSGFDLSIPVAQPQGSFCVCAQPMRDDVTLQHCHSLAGRIHKMSPAGDHFVYVPSQWETTLHCNIFTHLLIPAVPWILLPDQSQGYCHKAMGFAAL